MECTFEEALAQVTAPGEFFESDRAPVRRRRATGRFTNAPRTLVELFAPSRGSAETFLVYEDEEWTFDDVHREADALGHALVHALRRSTG